MTTKEERNEETALDVLRDWRKGRISARMRDGLLGDLGYEPMNKTGRYTNNGGGRRHEITPKNTLGGALR